MRLTLLAALLLATQAHATPPQIDPDDPYTLPKLRPAIPLPEPTPPHTRIIAALARPATQLPPPRPLTHPATLRTTVPGPDDDAAHQADDLHTAMAAEVANLLHPTTASIADAAARATILLAQAAQTIDKPQLVVVVDRKPAVERLYLMLARPGGPESWRLIGAAHVSTGQAGRKDYYITPVGVFAHTDAILDFRAQGTYNEHHVRGLGLAGMRVWDFGWQWAMKGWHMDNAGGDIRLQMHATDPTLLESRLGRPASEGCVRVSSTMNRFLDKYGVLDADYELIAVTDPRYANLLRPDRTPTPLGGHLLVVIDTSLPPDAPRTATTRPADWPAPATVSPDGVPPPQPGTDNSASE